MIALYLLADTNLPAPSPVELGQWLIGLAATVGIAVGVLTLIILIRQVGTRKRSMEPVTREEWEKAHTNIQEEVRRTQDDVHRLETYTQNRIHEVLDKLQPIHLKIEKVSILQNMMAVKMGVPTQMHEDD